MICSCHLNPYLETKHAHSPSTSRSQDGVPETQLQKTEGQTTEHSHMRRAHEIIYPDLTISTRFRACFQGAAQNVDCQGEFQPLLCLHQTSSDGQEVKLPAMVAWLWLVTAHLALSSPGSATQTHSPFRVPLAHRVKQGSCVSRATRADALSWESWFDGREDDVERSMRENAMFAVCPFRGRNFVWHVWLVFAI